MFEIKNYTSKFSIEEQLNLSLQQIQTLREENYILRKQVNSFVGSTFLLGFTTIILFVASCFLWYKAYGL